MKSFQSNRLVQTSNDVIHFLKSSKGALEDVIDNFSNPFFIAMKSGEILKANKAFADQMSIQVEDYMHHNALTLFAPEFSPKVFRNMAKVESNHQLEVSFETGIAGGKGRYIEMSWTVKRIRLPNVETPTFQFIGTDISQIKSKERENARLQVELEAARAVQETLLPVNIEIKGVKVTSFFSPASKISGDWFSCYESFDPDMAYFAIGDVTGHGFSAGLVTGVACGATFAMYEASLLLKKIGNKSISEEIYLEQLARTINAVIYRTGRKSGHLMTMLFAAMNVRTGKLTVLSAGHIYPILKTENGCRVLPPGPPSTILGLGKEINFEITEHIIPKGAVLFLYTDGLTENANQGFQSLNTRDIRKIIKEEDDTEIIKSKILTAYRERNPDRNHDYDDVCFMILKYEGLDNEDQGEKQ